MRALAAFVLACVMATLAHAAPPPPPPPPPEDMPAIVEGYETGRMWSNYASWLDARLAVARETAVREAPPPAAWGAAYREAEGPRFRGMSEEVGGARFGSDMRIDQWCAYPNSQRTCTWIARTATTPDTIWYEFLRANFDLTRAIAHLKARGITPAVANESGASSYGLADPASDALAVVTFKQATEAECPGINAALTAVRDRTARLTATTRPLTARESPPPPVPHAGVVELTLPNWAVRGSSAGAMGGRLVLRGRGTDTGLSDLTQALWQPLSACVSLN